MRKAPVHGAIKEISGQVHPNRLSAYLITLNEAEHLDEVLSALTGVDEIIVVDSGSTDGTIAIAERHGAKIISHPWEGYSKQKAYAMSLCTGEWVLSIDGDEILLPGSIDEIRKKISHTSCNGFYIKRYEVFMKKAMTKCRGDKMLRIYKKEAAQWDLLRLVHEHIEVAAPIGTLESKMIHYGNDTISKALGKINSYSSLKAQQKKKRNTALAAIKMLTSPAIYFLRYYIFRSYHREGMAGFIYSCLQAGYGFLSEAKIIEIKK